MSFLSCKPSVFVIGSEYEILLNAEKNGIFSVEIGGTVYYEENSGVLSSEKPYAKIRVPQIALNSEKCYTVCYREAVNRKAYFSEMGESVFEKFNFKPLTKTDNINFYYISDVHYRFDVALNAALFFGDELDALVVNGDMGELESEQNYFNVCKLVADISGGEIPVIFVRGNHDTRGRLAERFTDHFPSNGKKTYYTFELGPLHGIALDCGEDKLDSYEQYAGNNVFEAFRRKETDFLKALSRSEKLTFAVSHICPAQVTIKKYKELPNPLYNIENDVYAEWNEELARLGVKFMLCGHYHKTYILERNDKKSTLPNEYPVIIGAEPSRETYIGTALTLSGSELLVRFTNDKKEVLNTYTLDLDAGVLKSSSVKD